MRLSERVFVALAILIVLPTVRLAAQQARTQFFMAGGVEASALHINPTFTPGFTGLIGVGWQKPASRFGWRFAGINLERKRDYPQLGTGSAPYLSHMRARVAGLEAQATYALTRGRIRPYLVGGLGVYRSSFEDQIRDPGANDLTTAKATIYGGGASAGLGVSAPVPGGEVFLEGRFVALSGGRENRLTPVTLGFRFAI